MSADLFRRLARNADRFATACAMQAAAAVVARVSNVPQDELLQPGADTQSMPGRDAVGHFLPRDPDQKVLARREVLYLTVTHFERPQRSISRVFGISQPAVNKGIGVIEARRDDPFYDRKLDELELELMGAA